MPLAKSHKVDRMPFEHINGFFVGQMTRGTQLEATVGADLIYIPSKTVTEMHTHAHAENVILVLAGKAEISLGSKVVQIKAGDRIRIEKGTPHGFRTGKSPICFMSVQAPPILNRSTGAFDVRVVVRAGSPHATKSDKSRRKSMHIAQMLKISPAQ